MNPTDCCHVTEQSRGGELASETGAPRPIVLTLRHLRAGLLLCYLHDTHEGEELGRGARRSPRALEHARKAESAGKSRC